MSANSARGERRRRLMQDGLLTSLSGEATEGANLSIAATGRRYVLGRENFACRLGAALAPQGAAAWSGLIGALLAVVVGIVAADHYQAILPAALAPLVQLGKLGSFSAWLVTAGWGLAAVLCLVAYQLRRRRNDDFTGYYRWWFAASGAALLLSIDGSTHWRVLAADALASASGVTTLRAEQFGCAAIDLGLFGLIALKVVLDLRYQVAPFAWGLTAVGCFLAGLGVSAAGFTGLVPATLGLTGAAFALLAPWAFVRGIVAEVTAAEGGETPAQARRSAKESATQGKIAPPPVEIKSEPMASEPARPVERPRVVQHDYEEDDEPTERVKTKKEKAKWVSGTEGSYRDSYEADDEDRPGRAGKEKKRRERNDRRAA